MRGSSLPLAGRSISAASARHLTDGAFISASCCYGTTRLGHASVEEEEMTKANLVEQVADAIGPRVTKRGSARW